MRTIINTQNSRNRIRYLLVIAFIGMIAVMASTADARPKNPLVRKAIHRTHILIVHAAKAAKKGGQDKTDLRKAVVNQRAARWCLNHDKPQEAAVLTLMARALARKVVAARAAGARIRGAATKYIPRRMEQAGPRSILQAHPAGEHGDEKPYSISAFGSGPCDGGRQICRAIGARLK